MEKGYKPLAKEKMKMKSATLLDVDCPSCGNLIHPSNININKSMGKCDSCETVFAFEKDDFFLDDRPGRPEMIMPEGTDVLTLSDSLDIRVDWLKSYSKGGLGFLILFTVMWNAVVGVFLVTGFASGAISALLGVSVHLIVGLSMIYWLASVFMNKTDIIIKSNSLRITHGPLRNPFKPDKIIEAQDFKQLYVSKYVQSTTNGKPNYAYALFAIKNNGTKVMIIEGMNKETQLYREQEIERYLRIRDSNVSGSIRQ